VLDFSSGKAAYIVRASQNVSEYLLAGITISIAASLAAGGWEGVVEGLCGIHAGRTLRAQLACENVWVIFVLGAEATSIYLAFFEVGIKDFALICLIFVLTIPSIGWMYSQSKSVSAKMAERFSGRAD
jgi:hypothetical protein